MEGPAGAAPVSVGAYHSSAYDRQAVAHRRKPPSTGGGPLQGSSDLVGFPEHIHVVLHGMLYRIPMHFLINDHPGGAYSMLQYHNKDISNFFGGHSENAHRRMTTWLRGPVVASVFPWNNAEEHRTASPLPSAIPSTTAAVGPSSFLLPSASTHAVPAPSEGSHGLGHVWEVAVDRLRRRLRRSDSSESPADTGPGGQLPSSASLTPRHAGPAPALSVQTLDPAILLDWREHTELLWATVEAPARSHQSRAVVWSSLLLALGATGLAGLLYGGKAWQKVFGTVSRAS